MQPTQQDIQREAEKATWLGSDKGILGNIVSGVGAFFKTIKHVVNPESKELDKQRDWNDATLKASQKLQADVVRQEIDDAADEYLKEQEEIKTMENKLSNLPEFSDDYVKTKKFLADKKTNFDRKQAMYYEKLGKYKNVREDGELIKLARGPIASNFTSEDSAKRFFEQTIGTAQPQNEDEQRQQQLKKNVLTSIFQQYAPVVNDLIREGIEVSPDKYYNDPKFLNIAKGITDSLSGLVKDPTGFMDADGSIDGEKLLLAAKSDPLVAAQMEKFEDDIRAEKERVHQVRWGKETGILGGSYANVVNTFRQVTDLQKNYELMNDPKKSYGFFGDKEIKNLLYSATDTDFNLSEVGFDSETGKRLGRYLQTNVLARPLDLPILVTEFLIGGMSGKAGWISKLDKGIDGLEFSSNVGKYSPLLAQGAGAVKTLLKKAPRAVDEIIMSLPINATIDGWVGEYDNLGLNTVFDVGVGLLAKVNPDGLKNIINASMNNFGDAAGKTKVLKGYFSDLPENLDVMNKQDVSDFVSQRADVREKSNQFELTQNILKERIQNAPDEFGLEFFDDFFNKVIPTSENVLGVNFSKFYGDAITEAKRIISDVNIPEAEKLIGARNEFKKVINTTMTQKAIDNMTKYKISQMAEGTAFNAATQILEDMGGISRDKAKIIALEAIILSSDEKGLYTKVFNELGDIGKTESVVKNINDTIKPLLDIRNDTKALLKETKQMVKQAGTTPIESSYVNVTIDTGSNKLKKYNQKIAFLEGQNNTGAISSAEYMKQKDKIIQSISEDLGKGMDQFDASNYYDKVVSGDLAGGGKYVIQVAVDEQAKVVENFVAQLALDSGGKLNRVASEFISQLPPSIRTEVVSGMSKFYEGLKKKTPDLFEMGEGLTSVLKSVSSYIYDPDFYKPYERFLTDDESIKRVFGGDFLNFLNLRHKGMVDADVLGELHTNYLLEKFLFFPNELDGYMRSVMKNGSISDGEKALLLAQVKELDSKVIDPISSFIHGMMDYSGQSIEQTDNILSIIQIADSKNIVKKFFEKTGETIDDAFEKDFLNVIAQFNSEYSKALALGVSSKGSPNYIPQIRDVVYGIKNAIDKGELYDIPVAYLNSDGIRILNGLFAETRGADSYYSFIDTAFKKKQGQMHISGDILLRYFYDAEDGVLRSVADIDGKQVFLYDVLKGVDPRLSDNTIGNSGGIVFSNSLSLTKYQLIAAREEFVTERSGFLKQYLSDNYAVGTMKGDDLGLFVARTESMDVAESYMKIVADVETALISKTKAAGIDLPAGFVEDFIHPMFYSFDEYFRGIAKGDPNVDIVQSVLNKLTISQKGNGNIGNDIYSALYDLNIKGGFITIETGQQIKNYNLSGLAEARERYAIGNGVDVAISPELLDDYLYKTIGYFLSKPDVNTISGNVLEIFAGKITQIAKNSLSDAEFKRLNSAFDTALFQAKSADMQKLAITKVEVKKLTSKANVSDELVESYFGFLENLDNKGARKFLMPSVADFIKQFRVVEDFPSTPSQIIDNAISISENRQIFRDNFLAKQGEISEKMIRQRVAEQIQKGAELVETEVTKDGVKSIELKPTQKKKDTLQPLLDALGVGTKDAKEILTQGGYSDDVIEELISNRKKPVNDMVAIRALTDMIENGEVSAYYLMKNQAFQRVFNKMQEGLLNKYSQDQLLALNEKTGEINRRVLVDFIKKDGQFQTRMNESFGKFWDNVFKATLTLNARGVYDKEFGEIRELFLDRSTRGIVVNPKMKIDGKIAETIGIGGYLSEVKKNMKELQNKNMYTTAELKDVAERAFKSAGGDKELLSLQEQTYKGQPRLFELYDFLSSYRQDISNYRGKFEDLGYTKMHWVNDETMLKDFNSIDQFTHRLTGMWVNMTNRDIDRLVSRYGFEGSAGQVGGGFVSKIGGSIKNIILKNFKRDIMYGGLYDKTAIDTVANLFSQSYVVAQYNIISNPGKFFQQLRSNRIHAKTTQQAVGLLSSSDLPLISNSAFTRQILGFELMSGREADIAMGDIGSIWSRLTQRTSGLYQADNLALKDAYNSSMAVAFSDIYDAGGMDAVNVMVKKMRGWEEFMGKYGIGDFNTFKRKAVSIQRVSDAAKEFGESPEKAVQEYERLRRFYFSEVEPIMSRARSAIGSFYVTDNVREFGSMRMIDNGYNRFFFALKKWSIGKATDYVYRLFQETDGTAKGVINTVINGNSDTLRQMSMEIAEFMRAGRAFERGTDGEYEAQDLMLQMAVPMVVFSMALFDSIEKGINRGSSLSEATESSTIGVLGGMVESLNNLMGTSFIYQNFIIQKFQQSITTASQYESSMEAAGAFIETFFRGFLLDNLTNKQVDKYRGIYFGGSVGGSEMTKGLSFLTNTFSTEQKEYRKLIDQLFISRQVASGGVGGAVFNDVWNINPVAGIWNSISSIFQEPQMKNINLSVVSATLEEYAKSKNLHLLTTKYLSEHGGFNAMVKLVDEFETIRMFERMENKLGTEGSDFVERIRDGKVSEEEIKKQFARVGITPELAVWTYIEQQLNFSSGFGKELRGVYDPLIDTEKTDKMTKDVMDFIISNKINISNDSGALLKFVNARTQLGDNYVMSDYMNAYANGIWKLMQVKHGLKDIKFGFEEGVDRIEAYTKDVQTDDRYITAVADYQDVLKKELYVLRPELVGENPYIGVELRNKYLEKAVDVPVNTRGGVLDYMVVDGMFQQLKKDGAITDEAMNMFNYMATLVNKQIKYSKGSSKDKDLGVAHMLRTANKMINVIDELEATPQEKASARMGLAYSFSPLADQLSSATKGDFDALMKNLSPEIQMFVDGLTGSAPTDYKTALEYATNKNLSGGEGGGKKKKIINAKPGKKNAEKLNLALKNVADLGTKIPGYTFNGGSRTFPKFSLPKGQESIATVDIDFGDLSIKIPTVGGKDIRVEGGTGKTERLEIKRKSSSSIPSKKTTAKKIKSTKSFRLL